MEFSQFSRNAEFNKISAVASDAKKTEFSDDELPPSLFERIEEVVLMAQDLSLPPTPYNESDDLNNDLIPALYSARTYIEVGQITAPEVHAGISRALRISYRLADTSRKYNTMVNRLRILLEDSDSIANTVKESRRQP